MEKNIRKNLKLNLFLIPTIVILISFCSVLITFNIFINRYIESIVSKQVEEEFKLFDQYISVESSVESSGYMNEKDDEDYIMNVYYIILDDKNNIMYPYSEFDSDQEKSRAYDIIEYFTNNPEYLNQKKAFTIGINDKTYYMKSKIYDGKYDLSFSFAYHNNEKPDNYTVLMYVNISQMQNFLNVLNMILLFLMIFSGLVSIIIIFQVAKKIDNSFNKLKSYIIKVGKREKLNDLEDLPYEEFNDVSKIVNNMSNMIYSAEESQKQFFQNASHELRTPLMSIQGYAEAIKSGVIKDENAIDVIIKESERMSSLVNEILFLSKMEMSNQEINKEVLDVKELIYYVSWSIKGSADKKNILIEHELSDENLEIYGDEQRLERAFLNILSNAVRYAKSKIIIKSEADDKNCIITITDDGDGISSQDLPKIFDRFYKGIGGNFGIGLSITKDIINQHDGKIYISSNPGNTSFIISIPKYLK